MKIIMTIVLVSLLVAACALDPMASCPDQACREAVARYGPVESKVCDLPNGSIGMCYIPRTEKGWALKAQDDRAKAEATRAWEDQEARRQADRRAQAEQARNAETERNQKMIEAQIASDEARGYKHVTLNDFILDRKTIPLGTKRVVTGFYTVTGQLEALSTVPQIHDRFPYVVLLTDSASRQSREKFLNCRIGVCRLTLLGHTAACEITRFGTSTRDVCLAVEDAW